ncbi:MAG: hypothetical protein ONB05_05400 [candidate division KSB1 bacterium]|nr:hypothetical protein [candidate division KSB1 bacterium]
MKRDIKKMVPGIILCLLINWNITRGQVPADTTGLRPLGFIDRDRNGINDLFCDANGDGINDVTGKPYPHPFDFEDKNNDGINDLWVDRDGDGVNDLMFQLGKKPSPAQRKIWVDKDGDGILDQDARPAPVLEAGKYVLDMNKDGKNDITGLEFASDNPKGHRFGFVDEELGEQFQDFRDKDGDGMDDRIKPGRGPLGQGRPSGMHDYFIDRDGDGIHDGRGFRHRGEGKRQEGRK